MARTREITPGDLADRAIPPIDLSEGRDSQGPEQILQVDRPMSMTEADALAFGEQEVTIRVEQNPMDDKPVLYYEFGVQGRYIGVKPGLITRVRRKYLEGMLRSNQYKVHTESFRPGERDERNLLHRTASRRFMLSIIHDPDPRGPEWAARCVLES